MAHGQQDAGGQGQVCPFGDGHYRICLVTLAEEAWSRTATAEQLSEGLQISRGQ